ncbi:MAG: MFS transporter [Acidimicrobiia bacterium]|nr:MFS transporter [Acidimicrobiia bacterium]
MGTRRLGSDYRRLFAAGTISNLGDGVMLTAAPSLAATLTTDARLVSGLAAAQTLPWLLFALLSGAVVDRLDRRRVMVAVDTFRAVAFCGLTLLVATDWIGLPILYVVFFALGVSETLFDTAALSLMPSIVAPENLATANGRLQSGEVVANHLVGPPFGGLLFAAAAAAPFAVEAASFALAALLVWRIRAAPSLPMESTTPPPRRSLRADIAEGLSYLFRNPLLRVIAVVLGVWNLLEYMMVGIMVLFCTRRLGLSEAGFGLVLSSMAVGGLLGGITSDRLCARSERDRRSASSCSRRLRPRLRCLLRARQRWSSSPPPSPGGSPSPGT